MNAEQEESNFEENHFMEEGEEEADRTIVDSNIEYYYTESESEPEDLKEREETATRLKEFHRQHLDMFVKSSKKLTSEFVGIKSGKVKEACASKKRQ